MAQVEYIPTLDAVICGIRMIITVGYKKTDPISVLDLDLVESTKDKK